MVFELHFAKRKLSVSVLAAFVLATLFTFTSFSAVNEHLYKNKGTIVNAKILDHKRVYGSYFTTGMQYSITYSFKDKMGRTFTDLTTVPAHLLTTTSALNDRIKIQYINNTPDKSRIGTETYLAKYINLSMGIFISIIFCLHRKTIINLKPNSYLELYSKLKS